MKRVAVAGANGRMGRALTNALQTHDHLCLGATFGRNDDPQAAIASCDVLIDFTLPDAVAAHAQACTHSKTPWVLGTTGLSDAHCQMISDAAEHVAVVQAYNMSTGVNLLADLVRRAAAILDETFDAEILELHHKHKVDSPSGTAYLLAEAVAQGRGINAQGHIDIDRTGLRPSGNIGMAALRGGAVAGEHTVLFVGEHERIELKHIAGDRSVFARGALTAAERVLQLPPGLYDMRDVLRLR